MAQDHPDRPQQRDGPKMTQTFLRINDVSRITALPRSTIYEMASKGKFPKQVRLSPRITGWIENEILAWQRERIAERDAPEAA
jgi:prophage regulatory protein